MDPTQEIQAYLRSKGVQHAVIKGWLDQFAHDLAEAIRESCTCPPGECSCNRCADLIDSEV